MKNYLEETKNMVVVKSRDALEKIRDLCKIIGTIVVLIGVFALVMWIYNTFFKKDTASSEYNVAKALTGYDHKVSAVEIKSELLGLGELATAKYTYVNQAFVEEYREVLGISVPFTSHTISITCNGVIKAGYDVDDIEVEVNDKVILVELPSPRILDNYIDSYYTKEDNNIFNPIKGNEISDKLEEIKKVELEKCRDEAYKKAEKEVKKNIVFFLQQFQGYTVQFT